MQKLTKKDVEHVAKLAKLNLSKTETEKYLKQLSVVLDYISELSEVDTKNIQPTNQTTGLEDVYRLDEIDNKNCLSQDQALSGTDRIYNGYFKVGAILSERSDK